MKKQLISFLFSLWSVGSATTTYAQTDWQITGNVANPNNSDFIGTLNNQALNFKVGNVPAGTIGPQGTVLFGYQAGNNGIASGSIGIGLGALSGCGTLVTGNIGIGVFALSDNPLGNNNTAIGQQALEHNWDGNGNTATGAHSLSANYSGDENTAHGIYSLGNNHAGNYNTGTGAHSLFSNTGGNNNTAMGWSALRFNTMGYENTGIGGWSLYSNTTGMANTATGMYSLNLNTTGSYNTSLGWNTLSHNQTGYENLASGAWSMYWNTTGYRNCAVGTGSLSGNSIGWANTAMGYYALTGNTQGHGNVAYGYRALNANTTGNDNTALGNQAFLTGTNFYNSSAIGYRAQPQGSNEIVLGNASILSLRCHTATITTGSDKRIKDEVKEDVPGLEFIGKLRPVTYNLNVDKLNGILGVKDSSHTPGKYDIEKRRITGLIAQEVEEAAKNCHYEFSGVDKPQQEGGLYGLRYSEFVVPLVKATQELNTIVTEQSGVIATQKHTIEDLEKRLERMEMMLQGHLEMPSDSVVQISTTGGADSSSLSANFPNPFDGTTTVRYYLAAYSGDAFIRVVTMEGYEVAAYRLKKAGEGKLSISSESLHNGIYFYELMVDGKLVASRKLVIQK